MSAAGAAAPGPGAAARGAPSIGELVELEQVETVVRLDGSSGRLGELVLTGDVVASLAAVLAAAGGNSGAGFFVVGPFGSGKSHFLAALGELLEDPSDASRRARFDPELERLAGGARPSLVVPVPLVEYRAEASLEDVVLARARQALDASAGDTSASAAAVAGAGSSDRLASWDSLLEAAGDTGAEGLLVLLDELSEFLKAKQGPALTEDLRFLQFLGEWASRRPVIVCCAMQESIEEVANVSQRELARIRDRYRPSLTLSMRHVEDLVRGRLVRLRPGAEQWIARAHAELTAALPAAGLERERLERCYPLHPGTLAVLEGLRFVLSQTRGVVDFICTQVRAGSDKRYDELVSAERVFDHFRARLLERPETARLSATVVPYYERAVGELVDPDDAELALRTVKLLCLLAASPLERPRTAAELASLLLVRVSELEPAANVAYLEEAVLRPLAAHGAYLAVDPGPPARWRVELGADAALVLGEQVTRVRAELSASDRRLVATCAELGSSPQLPLQLLAEVGLARRELIWQNTLRGLVVGPARVLELGGEEAAGLAERAAGAGAEGVLLVAELEPAEHAEAARHARALVAAGLDAGGGARLAVWLPAPLTPGEIDTLLELHSRRLALEAAEAEGRDDVAELLRQGADGDATRARELLRRCYFGGEVIYPEPASGESLPLSLLDLPSLAGLSFESQLPRLADPLFSGLHPRHLEVAPRAELVGERLLRRLVVEVITPGRLGPAAVAQGQLAGPVANYLAPLGIARARSDGVSVAPDPARSPAVAEALRVVGDREPVAASEVAAALAAGPFGLTEPETLLVLNACVRAGLLECWRGRRRLEEPLLALTASDRLGAGELVEPAVRAAVAALAPVTGPGPFEPWSAGTQRDAWQHARSWCAGRRERLAEVSNGLAALEGLPTLGESGTAQVLADVAVVGAAVDACSERGAAAAGLRQLVAAVPEAELLLAAARRLDGVARFFRDELRRVDAAAAYLTHPELVLPESQSSLRRLHETACSAVGSVLELAAGDRLGELNEAVREFRSCYLAAYEEHHDRYYSAVGPAELERIRTDPRYLALAGLSSVGATSVRDDLVRVERLLAAAVPQPCRRRVDLALAWKPRCECGLGLGDEPPRLDAAALLDLADRGSRQHLAELARPEHAERIADAAADLAELGRTELAADLSRLLALVADSDTADPGDVALLVSGELAGVLRDVLGGGQLIVRRDLAELREDLIGRRFPKHRLLELVAAWVDPGGELARQSFVEVIDSADPGAKPGIGREPGLAAQAGAAGAGAAGEPAASLTGAVIAERFPGLASLLPYHQQADAFWLAAWWAGRPQPPVWIPAALLGEGSRLAEAAEVARSNLGSLAELRQLDARVRADTVLGREVAAALDAGNLTAAAAIAVIADERLLSLPVRLAAGELARRLPADWQLAERLDEAEERVLGASHALLAAGDFEPLWLLLRAARHLAAVERALPQLSCADLVEEIYPRHLATATELVSRAELACASGKVLDSADVDAFRGGARRLARQLDAAFQQHAEAGFPGCLLVHEVGREVVAPLLEEHGRVAVLLVDALRADLATHFVASLEQLLTGRPVRLRWAVVPAPTRTKESVAALALGRPVPGGSAAGGGAGDGGEQLVPFAHLGYESAIVVGADRDHRAGQLAALWAGTAPLSVAVATGVDERLHRTSVEPAALIDEAATALGRRLLPSLASLPDAVPLVVLADHGFRENPSWGRGPEGRYVHGGCSLEECVIPVVAVGPRRS